MHRDFSHAPSDTATRALSCRRAIPPWGFQLLPSPWMPAATSHRFRARLQSETLAVCPLRHSRLVSNIRGCIWPSLGYQVLITLSAPIWLCFAVGLLVTGPFSEVHYATQLPGSHDRLYTLHIGLSYLECIKYCALSTSKELNGIFTCVR